MSHDHSISLRQRLKTITLPLHDELEATPLARALAAGEVSPERLAAYLKALHALHHEVETAAASFDAWSAYHIDISKRTRVARIKADLAALGSLPDAEAPLHVTFPMPWSFPAAVGAMYVLEGSTMGGRLLSQRLANVIGNDGRSVTRYFNAYGELTLPMWQEYCVFLDTYAHSHPKEINEVILGATAMFLTMKEVMDGIH